MHIIGLQRSQYKFTPDSKMNITLIDDFIMDISSSQVRKDIMSNKLDSKSITKPIRDYIIINKLYGYRI